MKALDPAGKAAFAAKLKSKMAEMHKKKAMTKPPGDAPARVKVKQKDNLR